MNSKHFLFLLTFFFLQASAQKVQLDSLQKVIAKYDEQDKQYLPLLNAIALAQVNVKPDDAIITAGKAISLAQKLNNQIELAAAYNNNGFILMRKSSYDDANELLKKSLAINTTLNNQNGIAGNSCNMAEVLRRQGEKDSAKTMFEKALSIYTQIQNENGIADVNYYLGLVYRNIDEKKMMECNEKAMALYKKTGNVSGIAYTIDAKGAYYYRKDDYSEATKYLNEAIRINEQNGNLYGLAIDYGNIANVYGSIPNYPKSNDYFLKALRIHEKMGSVYLQGVTCALIGGNYLFLNQYEKALEFTLKGIALLEQSKSFNDQYVSDFNQAGMIYSKMNNTKKAFEYLNKGLALALKSGYEFGISGSYTNLGYCYLQINKCDSAIMYFNKALVLDKKLESPFGCALDYVGLGKSIVSATEAELLKSGIKPSERNAAAIDYLENAIKIGEEINAKEHMRDGYEQLSIIYEKQGDTKKSYNYYKQFIAYRDSIMNNDNYNSIELLQVQYDSEKQEQKIALLNKDKLIQEKEISKQKTARNSFIGGFMLVLILIGVLYNRYRLKQKSNEQLSKALTELKNTQQQLVESEKMAAFGIMASRVAHEIQNPLNFVNNFSELSDELIEDIDSYGNEEVRKEATKTLRANLKKIQEHGKRADNIVKQLQKHIRAGTAHEFFTND